MKKYIQPKAIIRNIQLQSLMAGSLGDVKDEWDPTKTLKSKQNRSFYDDMDDDMEF